MVTGMLHARSVVALDPAVAASTRVAGLIVPALAMPADAPVAEAFATLRGPGHQIAIVHRGGRPVGVVTLEDLAEEVVGEVRDEHDPPAPPAPPAPPGPPASPGPSPEPTVPPTPRVPSALSDPTPSPAGDGDPR
jgi:hypothetical protein